MKNKSILKKAPLVVLAMFGLIPVSYGSSYTLSYNESESLNFKVGYEGVEYPVNLGTGTISGTYSMVEQQTGESNSGCYYFQLSGSNISASYDGTGFSFSFTTPWCNFSGQSISCPVGSYSLNEWGFDNDFDFNLVLSIDPTSGDLEAPSVDTAWEVSGNFKISVPYPVPCCGNPLSSCFYNVCTDNENVNVSGSSTINFPVGTFADFAAENITQAAQDATNCTQPTS